MDRFNDSCDFMRTDLGEYPTYLYDNNPFNDVKYLFNRDVLFNRVYPMIQETKTEGFTPGIRSFDDYSNWQSYSHFGIESACLRYLTEEDVEQVHLTDEEKEKIRKNVEQNVTSLPDKYPNVDFYYYFPPYSVIRWDEWKNSGNPIKMLETKAFITELIIQHDNIKLFSFSDIPEITTNLNHYKDNVHYAEWVNSFIMQCLHDGRYRLTPDNYRDYDEEEYDFYTTYVYTTVNWQEDYEDDYYAAAELNGLKTGAAPIDVLNDDSIGLSVNHNGLIADAETNINVRLDCCGTLDRDPSGPELGEYLRDYDYNGVKFTVDLDKGYDYLCFKGQKINDHGGFAVYVYDSEGNVVASKEKRYEDLDNEWHQYVLNLSDLEREVTVIINGGYTDWSGSPDSDFWFFDIYVQ